MIYTTCGVDCRNTILTYLLKSSEWRDLFDVIIVEAKKPTFYDDSHRYSYKCRGGTYCANLAIV